MQRAAQRLFSDYNKLRFIHLTTNYVVQCLYVPSQGSALPIQFVGAQEETQRDDSNCRDSAGILGVIRQTGRSRSVPYSDIGPDNQVNDIAAA